jgi:ABC-2 type transport system ATP-binding protein
LILRRWSRDITAIVSTAYLDEAERCDQVVLLDGGRAMALDTPEALQAGTRDRAMLSDLGRLPVSSRAADGGQVSAFGDTLHVQSTPERDWLPLADAGASAGEPDRSADRTLHEDIFIETNHRDRR